MYKLVWLIGWAIRQFLLPNPFTPLGDSAEVPNWIFGALLVPITYIMVGLIYRSGEAPIFGSILFLIGYAINTAVLYGICACYPMIWLMVLIGVVYLGIVGFVAVMVNKARSD